MTKVLVFAHGAGKQLSNYAEGPVAAIALANGDEPLCVPVYFADICNVGSPVSVAPLDVGEQPPVTPEPPPPTPEPVRMTRFKAEFASEVQKNLISPPPGEATISTMSLSLPFVAELIATETNEIARYLFEPSTYSKIQARICDGLAKAAELGDSIVVVSHSLGTIVAFDALCAVGGQYDVATFFTLGCPLGLLRRLGQRTMELGQISADHVREWQNWFCTADPISTTLGQWFPQQGYRLHDVYVNVAPSMPAAHDYLTNQEVLMAIARAVR